MYHFLLPLPARVPGLDTQAYTGAPGQPTTPQRPPQVPKDTPHLVRKRRGWAELPLFHCLLSDIHSPVKRTASHDTPTRTHVLGKCHRDEWSSGNMQARGCSIWFKLKDREKRSSTFLSITGVQKVDIVNKSPGDLLQRGSRNMKCKYTEMAQIGVRTRP